MLGWREALFSRTSHPYGGHAPPLLLGPFDVSRPQNEAARSPVTIPLSQPRRIGHHFSMGAGFLCLNILQKMNAYRSLCLIGVLVQCAVGGQSALTTTYQPLDNLGEAGIVISPVVCHHWFANSSSSAVDLIAVRNVPPTDNPAEATEDLNLASVCGVKFSTCDLGVQRITPMITMDATGFLVPERFSHPKEEIVRACLECLRRCLPKVLRTTPVTLKCKENDREWMQKIIAEFNAQARSKPFYVSRIALDTES